MAGGRRHSNHANIIRLDFLSYAELDVLFSNLFLFFHALLACEVMVKLWNLLS